MCGVYANCEGGPGHPHRVECMGDKVRASATMDYIAESHECMIQLLDYVDWLESFVPADKIDRETFEYNPFKKSTEEWPT